MEQMKIGQLYPTPIPPGAARPANQGSSQPVKSFQEILDGKVLKFSHHAEVRLKQRGIELKPEQMTKIESAIDRAAAKGAKDSLLIMNDLALIVNVKSRTIVTAMDGAQLKDNVFTQIDSAVVVS
ncbi:TIGR02530 family flagellar biosynthesis protein [Gorillibacterium sp. sgz5001074]|uniref:TIGR02530 family flagellar biosynthesis protein n=1 Tax=Gorillibacterium sp. sgz5001074 TaxID=3446695 RepID=UPI003F6772DB